MSACPLAVFLLYIRVQKLPCRLCRKRSRVSIPDLVCAIFNVDFNLSIFFSVQDCILQQIIDHLPEHRLISAHLSLTGHGNVLSMRLSKLLVFPDQRVRLCAHIDLCLSANPACLAKLRESKRLLDHTVHIRDILKHLLRIIFPFLCMYIFFQILRHTG